MSCRRELINAIKIKNICYGCFLFTFILGVAFFFFWQVRDLQIVRIGLYHAKMAIQLLDTGFNIDAINTFGKYYRGMGLALIATPFINLLGLNLAVKFASFITTSLFLIGSYFFFQHFNLRANIPKKYVYFEMLLLFWNPLVIHQFSSAYADSGVSLMYLLTLLFFDRLQTKDGGWASAILLTLCLLIAYYFKTIGLAFPPLLFLIFCIQNILFRQTFPRGNSLVLLIVSAVLYCIIFYLAMNKYLGIFYLNLDNLQSRGDTLSLFSIDEHFIKIKTIVWVFCLTFSALNIYFLGTLKGFLKKRSSFDGLLITSTLIMLGIIFFEHGATYNLRLFLPIVPIFCFYLARGFVEFRSRRLMIGILILYFFINTITVVTYNIPSINRQIPQHLPIVFRAHDNFRIQAMVNTKDTIRTINEIVPTGGTLMVFDGYYVHGTEAYGHGVYDRMGLFREDIQIQYCAAIEHAVLPETGFFYIWRHPYEVPKQKGKFKAFVERFDYEGIIDNRLFCIKGPRQNNDINVQ